MVEVTTDRIAPPTPNVGERLRELRQQRELTVRALGERLGISASAVSQIERGVMQPSVSRLIEFAQVLDVPLASMFADERSPSLGTSRLADLAFAGTTLTQAAETRPITLDGGVSFRRLSPSRLPGLDFFESTYPPGSTATPADELFHHEGFETGTVTAGELTIEFDDEVVVMAAGDSISYPCHRSHRLRNDGDRVAVAVWLILHP
ncbi:helix-turn-helix domain-containing protein [Naumannella halotolerans]|uniref:helix-turn-helix domain-containing protein n=1 Tax=Naumannella halotolerans TaxID=993414 RepID=UPI00370DC6A5